MATPRVVDMADVTEAVDQITRYARAADVKAALRILALLVPEFNHNPKGEVRSSTPEGVENGAPLPSPYGR